MPGWKRYFYSLMKWDYDDKWDEQQRWDKHILTEDIKKRGDNIIFVLKPKLERQTAIGIEIKNTGNNKKHKKRNNI